MNQDNSQMRVIKIRKKEFQRIVFGSESERCRIDYTDSCPACETAKGEIHRDRCSLEQCPRCAGLVVDCGCGKITDAQLRRATRKQVERLVSLGCDRTWATNLRSGVADREIVERDPQEAERRRREEMERKERRQVAHRARWELCNQHRLAAEADARKQVEEWFVDFAV